MFYNPEIKKYTYIYITFALLALFIGILGINIYVNKIDEEYKILVYEVVEEAKGNVKELDKQGIGDYSASSYAKDKLRSIEGLKISFIIFLVLVLSLGYIISLIIYKNIFYKIKSISSKTEELIKQNYSVDIDNFENGDLGILTSNFIEMVNVIREGKEREKKEKIFLRDIISDISHQLKTPLSSLKVFNELLLNNLVENTDDKNKILLESKNQINRLEWLILSMLKLARLEAKSINFNIKEDNLYTTLEKSIKILDSQIKEKGHTVILNCPLEIQLLHDRQWLIEAIVNILKNSIEYTKDNGEIIVSVEKNSILTKIKIKDNGIGIEEKDLYKIFERFYRINNEVNANSIGIGLSLSKKIIEGQGGNIKVRSKKGEFTEFIITFINKNI